MSRTDKDTPIWVSTPWRPNHHPSCSRRHPCDLPPGPYRDRRARAALWRAYGRQGGIFTRCEWTLHWAALHLHNGGQGNAPRDYVRVVWTGPQRRKLRDAARRAAAEYRAGSPDLTELPTGQHRHSANWMWA